MVRPIEIAVISGKGGTGKTVLTSSLIRLMDSKTMADCDVEAPNLHLLLKTAVRREEAFHDSRIAVIDRDTCSDCGECFRVCRFDAVREKEAQDGWWYSIDHLSCDGCAACALICPQGAVQMTQPPAGAWYVSDSQMGPLVHATLAVAHKNSENLVKIVRREARRAAAGEGLRYVIIDGPAGIGGPVIAAIIGVSLAVVMTEPTLSGIHDLRRVIRLVQQLGIRCAAVINKYDLNPGLALETEEYLSARGVPLFGKIPFSTRVNKAIADGEFIVDVADDPAAEEIRKVAVRIIRMLTEQP